MTTNQILCFPRIERRSHSIRYNLFSFQITNEIFGLCCESLFITCSSRSGHLAVKQPIFADILSSRAISELFSTASASAITFILKAVIYEERRAFGMVRKIPVTKEILDWNVSQVTVTVAVFLQSRSSIYIFNDSLFSLLCLFSLFSCCVPWAISQFFPWGLLTQMAGYNQEFHSRLIADGFAFSFG